MKLRVFLLTMVVLLEITACAGEQTLQVRDAWARPMPAAGNGGVFFVIDNATGETERLLSASAPIAQTAELHQSMMHDGMMQMQMQAFVEIPARSKVTFKPGGLHVMLIGLKQDLKPGDTFPLTLIFEKSGELTIEVTVRQE